MIAFIVWIRMQVIFWLFIPIVLGAMIDMDDLTGVFCVGVAVVGFVFGLPGIAGNYVYISFLKKADIPRQQALTYLLIGFPFIMLCCIAHLFFWMASSAGDIWDLFTTFSGLVMAVVIATVFSTFSCYRLLFDYIYPLPNDKVV